MSMYIYAHIHLAIRERERGRERKGQRKEEGGREGGGRGEIDIMPEEVRMSRQHISPLLVQHALFPHHLSTAPPPYQLSLVIAGDTVHGAPKFKKKKKKTNHIRSRKKPVLWQLRCMYIH